MYRFIHSLSAAALFTVTLGVSGCAYDYSVEPSFGVAVNTAITQQTINTAGVGHDGVTPGLDGAAAKSTVDRYQRSYEQPSALGRVLSIGVGSSGSSGGDRANGSTSAGQ